jgi:hypothetical protein
MDMACESSDPRYLCSEMVTVLYEDRSRRTAEKTANLEEISSKTATLLLDEPLDPGQPISFTARGFDLYGEVESQDQDAILGWYVKIRLSRFSRWCGRMFVPEHFLALCASSASPAPAIGADGTRVFTSKLL